MTVWHCVELHPPGDRIEGLQTGHQRREWRTCGETAGGGSKRIAQVMHTGHRQVDHGGANGRTQPETSMCRFGTNLVRMHRKAGVKTKTHAARRPCHFAPQMCVMV